MKKKVYNPLLHYENKWVALNREGKKVLVAARTVEGVERKLKKLGKQDVVLKWVPPFDAFLSP